MKAPVSSKLAKLLKRKGFNEPTLLCYDKCDMLSSYVETVFQPKNYNTSGYVSSAPTIAEAVMWVHKKYGIWISVQPNEPYTDNDWCFILFRDLQKCDALEGYNTPTEAYEAAIEYCLTNLF